MYSLTSVAMKRTSVSHLNHGLSDALEIVGEWWTLLVIWSIRQESHKFEEMHNHLGIARNILADRLKTLVNAGVVEKRLYTERPKRYEYHLTPMGHDLQGVLESLSGWGDKWCRQQGHPSAGT